MRFEKCYAEMVSDWGYGWLELEGGAGREELYLHVDLHGGRLDVF